MKIFMAICLFVLFISGCGDGNDRLKCYREVKLAYPDAEIVDDGTGVGGSRWQWYVRLDDGTVLWVRCGSNLSTEITKRVVIFEPRECAE